MYNTALQDVLQSLDNIFSFSLRSIQGIREIFPTKAQVSRGFSITTITFNRGYASAFISIISLQEENILTIGLFFSFLLEVVYSFAPALTILEAAILQSGWPIAINERR